MTNYDKETLKILDSADQLRSKAAQNYQRAGQLRSQAGDEFVSGLGSWLTAGAHAVVGTAHGVGGAAYALKGTGHGLAGVVLAGTGAAAEVSEGARSWTSGALRNFAAWLTGHAEANNRAVGDGRHVTATETAARNLLQLSDVLYAEAANQFNKAGQSFQASGDHFLWMFAHGLAAAGEVWNGGAYIAGAAADVVRAAGADAKGVKADLAADMRVIAALMVQVQENVVQLDASAQMKLAALVASAANGISTSNDPQMTVQVTQDARAIDLSFRELLNATPALKRLPAAAQYLATHPH